MGGTIELVEGYLAYKVESGQWAATTVYVNRKALKMFAREFPILAEIESRAVERWIGRADSANYRRRRWSIVRGLLKFGKVDVSLVAPKIPQGTPRPLRDVDIGRLLEACDIRDELIVSFGICEGLRRGEMARLEISDVDLEAKVIFVRGKGGRTRWIPLTDATAGRFEAYLVERGRAPGPVLLGRTTGRGLKAGSISERMNKVFKDAGIYRRGVDLHSLRHTAATRLWMETSDLFMTQQLLGHASIRTTAIYVRPRPTEAMREAMNSASR
jgi:integrase